MDREEFEAETEGRGPVTIFVPRDVSEQVVAESLLREAGIPFDSRFDQVQNLIGWGQFGGTNLATGPVKIQVPAEYADEARQLFDEGLQLASEEAGLELPPELEAEIPPENPRVAIVRRAAIASVFFSLFFFGTYLAAAAVGLGLFGLAVRRDGIPDHWRVFAAVGALLGLAGLWPRLVP